MVHDQNSEALNASCVTSSVCECACSFRSRGVKCECVTKAFISALSPLYLPVMDLLHWKDMERTGTVLTGLVVGLLCLFQLSIITVLSTISLAVVCFSISVRIYYQVLYILNWGDGQHPFRYTLFPSLKKDQGCKRNKGKY